MREHVRIRREYVRLVRARKLDEAQKILEKIWDRKRIIGVESLVTVDIPTEPKVKDYKYGNLDDLILINGIGEKTVKDIKVIFVDLEDIKNALRDDRVALRDDIVEKLKRELIG